MDSRCTHTHTRKLLFTSKVRTHTRKQLLSCFPPHFRPSSFCAYLPRSQRYPEFSVVSTQPCFTATKKRSLGLATAVLSDTIRGRLDDVDECDTKKNSLPVENRGFIYVESTGERELGHTPHTYTHTHKHAHTHAHTHAHPYICRYHIYTCINIYI